ncbi:MAG: zinc chelation protein SecC [Arcobacter sp.]|nr:MAG: zinc chelation protein SecC [Arcobacter sp.]
MKACYCDSLKAYEKCCEPFLLGKKIPKSALELMRSRYSAYVLRKGQYLYDTCSTKLKNIDDIKSMNEQNINWLSLKVQSFKNNEVVFMAYYKEKNEILVLKEKSLFITEDKKIVYDSGEMLPAQIERNEICPCGSGKKYKKCCR